MVWAIVPLFILLAFGARTLNRTWFEPGTFFALFWAIETTLPVIFLPSDPVDPRALLFIFGAVICFAFGSFCAHGTTRYRPVAKRAKRSEAILVRCLAITLPLSFLAVLSPVVVTGYSLGGTFGSATAFVSLAHNFSVARYNWSYAPPLASQVLLLFLYAAPLLGGALAAASSRWKHRVLALAPFLPALLMTALQTQRFVTLLSALFWIGAYFSERLRTGKKVLFTKSHVALGTTALAALYALCVAAGVVRSGSLNPAYVPEAAAKVTEGAFGHLATFSDWANRVNFTIVSPTWGGFTFAGPASLFRFTDRLPGLFQDFVFLSLGHTSNIYTVFRLLAQDFTFAGSYPVLFLAGLISGIAYRNVRRGSICYTPILAAFYASALLSFSHAIFVYNSAIAAVVLFLAISYLRVAAERKHQLGRAPLQTPDLSPRSEDPELLLIQTQ